MQSRSRLTEYQKQILCTHLVELRMAADAKQAVCDRHADNPDSAAYRRAESDCSRILAEYRALQIALEDLGV